MESSKRTSVILWTSLAAATAGIVAVAAVVKWRERTLADDVVTNRLRNVQDVLADCYRKISEIEEHIPEMMGAESTGKSRKASRTMSNGSPALGS